MKKKGTSKVKLTVRVKEIQEGVGQALNGYMSVRELCDRAGLHLDISSGEVDEIPLASFFSLMTELSRIHYDESCNISKRPKIFGSLQFLLDQLDGCRSLRDALHKINTVGSYLNGAVYNKIYESNGKLVIVIDDTKFPYKIKDDRFVYCYVECMLVYIHCAIQYFIGKPESFELPHVSIKRSPSPYAEHLNFWQGRIKYNSKKYVMSYESVVGDIPLRFPPDGFRVKDLYSYNRQAISFLEGVSVPLTLRSRIGKLMFDGARSQFEVSKALGMSVTTMRRRLLEEGTTFRQERREVQKMLALTMLKAGTSVENITDKLGFSDPRSFYRAFKEWYGITPMQYQKNQSTMEFKSPI